MIEEMVATGRSSVLDTVAEAALDDEPSVRAAAAKALGALGDDRGLSPLFSLLKDRQPEVRTSATLSLRQLGDARAIDPLRAALEDPDHNVRWQAAGALNALGWRPANNTEFILRSVAIGHHEEAAIHGSRAVEVLVHALEDSSSPRRHAAAIALGKTGDSRAVKPLEKALEDEDSHVRVAAVEALSQLSHSQSAGSLLRLLRDPDHHVRAASVEALGRMGDTRVVDTIASDLLKDPSWDVRKLSVEALGRIKDNRVTQLLWQALKDSDNDVRQTAAHALGQIPDPRSIPPLVLALKDENTAVRQEAKASLRQIDQKWEVSAGAQSVIPELEAATNDKEYWVAQSAADTLAKINDMRQRMQESSSMVDPDKKRLDLAINILVDSLRDSDRDFRQAAVESLGRIGDGRGITPLVTALDDQDESVGRAAALALNHLNWEPAEGDTRRIEKIKSLMLRN